MPGLPQIAFLLSIVGLSVSLAGFSGLVAALNRDRRGAAIDAFRLRQIPEMALPTGFLALVSLALADSTGSARLTVQVAGGAGLLFTIVNALVLIERAREMRLTMTSIDRVAAAVINLGVIAAGVVCVADPTAGAFEWLLALMIARPGIAFLLALSEIALVDVAGDHAAAHDLDGDAERKRLDPLSDKLR